MSCKSLKKYLPTSMAAFLLFGITGLFFGFPGRHIALEITPILLGYIGGIFLFVVINFFMTGATDPGTYPKRSEPEDDEDELRAPVYINILIHDITVRMKWCSTCNFYRPPRVSHCSVCNNCIEKFDHHCPWVNNCIGQRNYRFFFNFLMLLSLHMVNVFGFSLWVVIRTNGVDDSVLIFAFSIAVMAVDGLIFIPVFGLFVFHISLVARGRTTNEQVTGKFRSGVNPFDYGCAKNCFNALCKPQLPKFINRHDMVDYKKYTITPPYTLDRENLSIHDINVLENGQNNQGIGAPSSPNGQNDVASRQKSSSSDNADAAAISNVPEVKIIPRNGSIRQELDPNRFRAKVTPVHGSSCQPSDAIAYACMDTLPNTDDISEGEQQNFEMTDLSRDNITEESPESHHSTTTKLMKTGGSLRNGSRKSKNRNDDSAEIKRRSSDSANYPNTAYRTDEILYDNFVMPQRDNSKHKTDEKSPEKDEFRLKTVSVSSETEPQNSSTYYSQSTPPGGRMEDPLANENNCNNSSATDIDQIPQLSEVCESGYVSTYNSTEQPLRDPDVTNKIELENAMRDIEANVALLQIDGSSTENLKNNKTVTSQKAKRNPKKYSPL